MPELVEQMYCSQQIVIPPKFPYILKRYCKAAIKTQPYDLLRWSFEYFRALAERRPPPVKLRLEYPIYSTEGGLTRGCLKVLANQLAGMKILPLYVAKRAWQAFCLDTNELKRIFCLCEVYKRAESVPFLHFIAVAAGLLTKCLTHTMILLCESLTKEPDGGSAAIPLTDFLTMYHFLAEMEAGADVKYYDGVREGTPEEKSVEEETEATVEEETETQYSDDGFWEGPWFEYKRISLIDGKTVLGDTISKKVILPLIGQLERPPSVERARQIERANYMSDRKGKPLLNEDVERKMKSLSTMHIQKEDQPEGEAKKEEDSNMVNIFVYDEENEEVDFQIYGEPSMDSIKGEISGEGGEEHQEEEEIDEEMKKEKREQNKDLKEQIAIYVAAVDTARQERVARLEQLMDEIAMLVDRFKTANYDLGMVAGRQMSTTSGEFIAQTIEKEIMAYIDEQIAILPDPELKKKKAKPDEVEMVRRLVEKYISDNMHIFVPEMEEVEEEELPVPEITVVYAVPGIGPRVEAEIIQDFEEYCLEVTKVQAEVIMPRNVRHYLCPPLEKYVEYKYPDQAVGGEIPKINVTKEEAPVGGKITD